MRTPSGKGVVCALAALAALAGCVRAKVPAAAARDVPPGQRGRWTSPIAYHGVYVTFELAEEEEATLVLPGGDLDFLGIYGKHPRGFDYRHLRFYIDGVPHEFEPGSTIYFHLPAAAGAVWKQAYGGLTLHWQSDGVSYAVEARHPAQVTWVLGDARVQLKRNGRVHYARRREARDWTAPLTLELDPTGALSAGARGGER
ncbi:MAG: hypothetical protein L0Z55_03690 [Planctomycetes bacterium]|nr:hypothetical protein [Planctomycetota bacterium]